MKNMDGKEIFGITFTENNVFKGVWSDHWNEVYSSDDEIWFETKKNFKHEEGKDFTFEYKYYVHITSFGEDDDNIIYNSELLLCPLIDFIHKDIINELIESDGVPKEYINIMDISFRHSPPLLYQEQLDFKINEWWLENKDVIETLEMAILAVGYIDSLRGIYLDKVINRIGTTNWDFLKELIFNSNAFGISLKRSIKELEESKSK